MATNIPLFLRHKWIKEPIFGLWVCHPLAARLDTIGIADPTCPGCKSTIDFAELDNPKRYPDAASLQLALDLLFVRLTVTAARKQFEAARVKT